MLERLYALPELAAVWRIADFCYGVPSPLHLFDRDGPVASFISQRGSRQGCVLGTLLFCLGLQPILEEASNGLDELTVSAYIDDLAVNGPLEQVSVFFDRLSSLSPTLGLSISLPKSSLLWSSDLQTPDSVRDWAISHDIPLVHGAVPLLGSMVGRDPDPRRQLLLSVFERWSLSSKPSFILCSQRRPPSFSFAFVPCLSSSSLVAPCPPG